MLVRILESNKGCSYREGQLVRLGEKQGDKLVKLGMAVQVPDGSMKRPTKDRRGIPRVSHNKRVPAPPMMPPRFICACGFVGKDADNLAEHKAGCR